MPRPVDGRLTPPSEGQVSAVRGEMADLGGRRLRVVRTGSGAGGPLVILEAGSFGAASDWAAVQARLGGEIRSLAYDRAGLGFSDPGPRPRDSRAVSSDLKRLLAVLGEAPPYILVAHSMAAVHGYAFALRWPETVEGLVLVDAAAPAALTSRPVLAAIRSYQRLAAAAPLAALVGATALLAPVAGDAIDVPEPAKSEKRRFFASPVHHRWAALEVREWLRDVAYVRGLGDLDRELPVATVAAGAVGGPGWKALQAEPAHRSRSGYAVTVREAHHASILGPRHAEAVVKAIRFVRDAARARRGA